MIHSNTWNHLTVGKRMSLNSFKNVIKMCLYICIKEDFALGFDMP